MKWSRRVVIPKICAGCGCEFKNHNGKFCNKTCYTKNQSLAIQKIVVCKGCNQPFPNNQRNARWCKVCVPHSAAHRRMRYYGITESQFQELLKRSGGMCELCFVKPWTDVDHDHETKRVRGLLCHKCNVSLHVIEAFSDIWVERAKLWIHPSSGSFAAQIL